MSSAAGNPAGPAGYCGIVTAGGGSQGPADTPQTLPHPSTKATNVAYAEPERAPKPRHRLTQKQIRFVREYVIHGNGSEAARKAGYKHGNSISQQAAENLRKPHLKAALAQEIARMRQERDGIPS